MAKEKLIIVGDGTGAERALQKILNKNDELTRKLQAVRREAKQSAQGFRQMASQARSELRSMVTGFVSVGAAVGLMTRAFSSFHQDLREAAEASEKFHKVYLDLAAMGGARRPEVVKRAKAAFVTPTEYARGEMVLRSVAPAGTTGAQINRLMAEMAEHRQTTTIPLGELARLYGRPRALFGEKVSAQEIQNALILTLKGGGAAPRELAPQYPRALAAGARGDLSLLESSALFAAATKVAPTAEMGATGIEALVRLRSGKTAEAQTLLRRAGITPADNLIVAMRKVRRAQDAGAIRPELVEKVIGEPGTRILPALLRGGMFERTLEEFRGAVAGGVDIGARDIRRLRGEQWFRVYRANQESLARTEAEKVSDVDAMIGGATWNRLDSVMRERGYGGFQRWIAGARYDIARFLRAGPETAAGWAMPGGGRGPAFMAREGDMAFEMRELAQELRGATADLRDAAGALSRGAGHFEEGQRAGQRTAGQSGE